MTGDIERIDTDDALASYLYRVDDRNGYFYSTVREVTAKLDIELVGVAVRYRGDQFKSAESLDQFRENVSRLAIEAYWFDDPIPTDGRIAEFLYRADWSDDAHLYAATRQEREVTRHELVGVVTRPPRETVETTSWGREDFEENVADVADEVVWFETDDATDPVESVLDELDRLDNSHDPTVAIFDGHEDRAVVAKVGDGYHMLSSALLYAREVTVEDIRVAWDRHGEPRTIPLSTQSDRFDAADFREVADLE
ncbi:hypothetical protein [Halosimplex pelagicum]|uniref:Uncharacterized protein n=1 Tax=Halosimplex pelagicum TaxID=869886 RepID=A0A7D5TT06_9EURY|nr:hypothetical protein [Halosimplex pelagicum]QLH81014.1 hypothetical protein HZS54_04900 [Halosimplex pelagicum]